MGTGAPISMNLTRILDLKAILWLLLMHATKGISGSCLMLWETIWAIWIQTLQIMSLSTALIIIMISVSSVTMILPVRTRTELRTVDWHLLLI